MSRVDALLTEREGYARRGLLGRVAQVDAELARFGVGVESTTDAPPERVVPAAPKPRGRPKAH